MNSKWQDFRLCLNIDSDIPTLYNLWTTRAGLNSWFLRTANFYTEKGQLRAEDDNAKAGDHFLWHWHGHSDDEKEEKQVIEANGVDRFAFRFSGNCLVSVRLFTQNQVTFVELIQSEIPWNEDPKKNLHVQCSVGWTFYMSNLKSVVEAGIDLRNKRLDVQGVISC
jgi:uncharacterized protein YndB with AHSA1/START domain